MRLLALMTFIWAFSFSFIGVYLAGKVDSYFAVLVRVGLASLIFIPFTNFKVANSLKLKIMGIGIIQIGIMYIFFFKSFLFLSVPEVLLFTIFTPIYVTIIYDLLKGKFNYLYIITAAIAVLGAYVIKQTQINDNFFLGFMMVQGANVAFALGQVLYKKLLESDELKDIKQSSIFGYFHFGALVISLVAFLLFGNSAKMHPDATQWAVLVWLGVVASGIGYFLWNKGATEVDSGILAIMNNAVIPLGLIVNLVLWGRDINYTSLIIGGGLIAFSLWLHNQILKRDAKLSI